MGRPGVWAVKNLVALCMAVVLFGAALWLVTFAPIAWNKAQGLVAGILAVASLLGAFWFGARVVA